MMKQTRESIDFIGEKRESMLMKARQNLGVSKRASSSRREIPTMPASQPQQATTHTKPLPFGMSATVGKRRPPTGVQRQKTTGLNSDIPTDLLLDAAQAMIKTGGASTRQLASASYAGKPRVPLPKRGKSAHPSRVRPQASQNDLTKFSWTKAAKDATAQGQNYNSSSSFQKTR